MLGACVPVHTQAGHSEIQTCTRGLRLPRRPANATENRQASEAVLPPIQPAVLA
jgi:hypothetical protein